MADHLTKERRSWNMSLIKAKNTKPEKTVRSVLHSMGYRFRIHKKNYPGHPDIVLPKYNTIIFVHGCFWHQHKGCKYATFPKTNQEFWEKKLKSTVERDKKNILKLKAAGFNVLVIWECQVINRSNKKIKYESLRKMLREFL